MWATLRLVLPVVMALIGFTATGVHAREIQAGPIWNDMDAQGKCPRVCQQNGDARWNGQWHTLPGTATSVCDCIGGAQPGTGSARAGWRDAGPLFNQRDAQTKCPGVCEAGGGAWDGNWKTTEPGRTSVCSCSAQGASRDSGAGAACEARRRGGCGGCSVQCKPGQRASCRDGSTWNDRLSNGDMSCVADAQCTCG